MGLVMPLAFFYVLQSQIKEVLCDWEPQGSTQYNVQYGEAPPKRGYLFQASDV